MKSLFIPHGSPQQYLRNDSASVFLKTLAMENNDIQGIICVSAHFLSNGKTLISSAEKNPIKYDFYGFEDDLYNIKWESFGSRKDSSDIVRFLTDSGVNAELVEDYELDHGIWMPISMAWPELRVPLIAMSIDMSKTEREMQEIGAMLRSKLTEGWLLIASGNITHNLRDYMSGGHNFDYVETFSDWVYEKLTQGQEILDFHSLNIGRRSHPTKEHLLPLFYAYGAVPYPSKRIFKGVSDRVISMDAYSFSDFQTTQKELI